MPEAVVIIIDNSEWMRNGDYVPTRMQAQIEAANFLCEAKTSQNAENTCAIISMGGQSPKVLLTLTPDVGKVMTASYNLDISGTADLTTALLVAQLTLQHRQSPTHHQRIVAFVGSPLVKHTVEEMKLVGERLKKHNILLDIVSFGEVKDNEEKLTALFNSALPSGAPAEAYMLVVPSGTQQLITDALISCPIVQGSESAASAGVPSAAAGGAGAAAGAGPAAAFGGVNAELDPELASVLRESMLEYERSRGAAGGEAAPAASGASAGTGAATGGGVAPMAVDEDEELRRALEMSMLAAQQQQQQQQSQPTTAAAPAQPQTTPSTPPPKQAATAAAPTTTTTQAEPMDLSDDELMQMALQMSMQAAAPAAAPAAAAAPAPAPAPVQATPAPAAAAAPTKSTPPPAPSKAASAAPSVVAATPDASLSEMLKDKDFLSELLSTLPGVNPEDAHIKDMVASLTSAGTTSSGEGAKKTEEKEDEGAASKKKKTEEEKKSSGDADKKQ